MEADENGTITRQKAHRAELIDPEINQHNGRIVKTTGDGLLVEFASVVDAVKCAVAIQTAVTEQEADVSDNQRIQYRIGINIGDIVIDGDDIFGDGVNVAARIEGLCQPGEVYLSSSAHDQVLGKLELSFENLGDQIFKNIKNPVRVYRVLTHPGAISEALPLPDKPSIAVLPFDNMSGDPEQEYFADGIAEDIITGLSKFHWFFVIARNSSFTYKGSAIDVKQVARELGVQYVLEGSVRKAANRVRITAQLIDATTGRHIWAERYDRNLDDIFAVQDEISEAITTTVAPAFVTAEAQRAERKKTENLDAWDYAMRGNWYLTRRSKHDIAEARQLFETAIKIDPKCVTALSSLAFALLWINNFGWVDDLGEVRKTMYDSAQRAVVLDDNDAWAHAILGLTRFNMKQLDAAVSECRRALELNPSLALAESILSITYSWRGDYDEAVQHAKMAQRLSPRDPAQSMWGFALTCAEFGAGRYELASELAKNTTETMPEFPGAWRYLAASLGHLDRIEEAQAATDKLLRLMPNESLRFIRTIFPSTQSERMERFVDGLRKAGVPEE